MASNTVKNPSPCDCSVRSGSQNPYLPETFWPRPNSVSARRKNPCLRLRGPPTSRAPSAVRSAVMASPSGVLSLVLAYFVPAFPPSELIFTASAMASTRVDFPEPFSPTRKVTGLAKMSPSAAIWRTGGMVNGHRLGTSPAMRMASMNTRPPAVAAAEQAVGKAVQRQHQVGVVAAVRAAQHMGNYAELR